MLINAFKLLILASYLISLALPAAELSCPSNYTLVQKAQALLALEFAGSRIDGMEGHDCLKQKHFPYILSVYDPSQEFSRGADIIVDAKTVKITSVQVVDVPTHLYTAKFTVQGTEVGKSKKVTFEDEFTFMENVSPVVQKTQGCASFIEPPEKIYARAECTSP